jgi:hypothetical protein
LQHIASNNISTYTPLSEDAFESQTQKQKNVHSNGMTFSVDGNPTRKTGLATSSCQQWFAASRRSTFPGELELINEFTEVLCPLVKEEMRLPVFSLASFVGMCILR